MVVIAREGCTKIFAIALTLAVICGLAILGLSFYAFKTYTPLPEDGDEAECYVVGHTFVNETYYDAPRYEPAWLVNGVFLSGNRTIRNTVIRRWYDRSVFSTPAEATHSALNTFALDYGNLCVMFTNKGAGTKYYWEEEMPINRAFGAFVFVGIVCIIAILVSLVVGLVILRRKWDRPLPRGDDDSARYTQLNEPLNDKQEPVI